MTYSAIIFDMDGVLLDSTSCHENAFKSVLSKYDIRSFHYENIAGMHTKAAFEKVFKENGISVSEEELKQCISLKRDNAFAALFASSPIDSSVNRVIASLSKKYKLALASSASGRLVEWFLKSSKTESYFSVQLSGDQVKHAKPSPEIYTLAAKKLSLPAEKCLVIEDAASGIQSAISAGMDVFVRLGTLSEAPKGEHIKASFKNLVELEELL